MPLEIICVGCKKRPDELEEYKEMAILEGITPEAYVKQEEGTYNRENGHFACTGCYIAMGCPSSPPRGWHAP